MLDNTLATTYYQGMNTVMQPHELNQIIRDNIRSRRKELGLTQKSVADTCGFTQSFIAQIESGKSTISIEALAKVAESLSTTPDALLTPGIFSQTIA